MNSQIEIHHKEYGCYLNMKPCVKNAPYMFRSILMILYLFVHATVSCPLSLLLSVILFLDNFLHFKLFHFGQPQLVSFFFYFRCCTWQLWTGRAAGVFTLAVPNHMQLLFWLAVHFYSFVSAN